MIERIGILLLATTLAGCDATVPVENQSNAAAGTEWVVTNLPSSAVPSGREPIGYTSLKPENCRLLEQNVEEGPYSRHRCDGIAGFALETSESDLRQDIVVIAPDGKRSELGLSSLVAKGAFNALGPTAEWRGKDKGAPTALIVRLGVANGAEPDRPDTSNLLVVKLAAPVCVVAVVPPGPGQNDAARDKADKLPAACLAV